MKRKITFKRKRKSFKRAQDKILENEAKNKIADTKEEKIKTSLERNETNGKSSDIKDLNVVFYYDPISHGVDSLWRFSHISADEKLFRGLMERTTLGNVNCKILCNEKYASILHKKAHINKNDVIILNESECLSIFEDCHSDINSKWFQDKIPEANKQSFIELIKSGLTDFVPNIFITWTPSPFLKEAYPKALVLHKESSLFQRAPFPSTFFLDPRGFYENSSVPDSLSWLKKKTLGDVYYESLDKLRNHFFDWIIEASPFKNRISLLRKSFDYILLLPLQYNSYFSFDGVSKFRTQLDLCEYTLKNTPKEVGVIITKHNYSAFSEKEENFIKENYSNAIFIEETDFYKNPSDLIIPFIDGVVTVTSTTGLKALFWRKKLISLCNPYLDWADDATSLEGINIVNILSKPYNKIKDKFLAWWIFNYSFAQHYNGGKNFSFSLLKRIYELYQNKGDSFVYETPLIEIRKYTDEIIRVSKLEEIPQLETDKAWNNYIKFIDESKKKDFLKNYSNPDSVILPLAEKANDVLNNNRENKNGANIVILYSSGRWNASGLYIQDISRNLVKLGDRVLIVAEGEIPKNGIEDGVKWVKFDFDGYLLSNKLKKYILDFKPDMAFIINVRLKPMRTALELHITNGLKFAIQSEDDDLLLYSKFHANPDISSFELLDKPNITNEEISRFLSKLDWNYTLSILSGRRNYRDVEPLIRVICYKLSILNTAIWYPLLNKLKTSFKKKGFVIPPCIEIESYNKESINRKTREAFLEKYKINGNDFVIFLAGTIYDFSKEFEIFLECLNIVSLKQRLCLVVTGRSRVGLKELINKKLSTDVQFVNMNFPKDDVYLSMMKFADVIAAPGIPDRFNKLRLSSRLVKAMALSKPIFTYKCGFGESLINNYNAVLTEGESAQDWANSFEFLTKEENRIFIGTNARKFAVENFDARKVAKKISVTVRSLKWMTLIKYSSSLIKDKTPQSLGNNKNIHPVIKKCRKFIRNPKKFFNDSAFIKVSKSFLNRL